MPHSGQVPASFEVTSGCIGHTYERATCSTAGTSFIPHLGHRSAAVDVTSGCIGQTNDEACVSPAP